MPTKSPAYTIGTGYCKSDRYNVEEFAHLWLRQVQRFTDPTGIVVAEHLDTHDAAHWPFNTYFNEAEHDTNYFTRIPCANLGHVHQLIGKQKPFKDHQLCGWSASIIMLMMIAYNRETDFVYIEQDTLIFGDVIGQAYRDMGEKSFVFGTCKLMGSAQSFFLVRHTFIPDLVQRYLATWPDTNPDARPEDKFTLIEKELPQLVGRLSFGLDRDRPINWAAPIWYCQHWKPSEIAEAKRRGLL